MDVWSLEKELRKLIQSINYHDYLPDLISDIVTCVQIPSVRDMSTATEQAPYGEQVARVRDWLVHKAHDDGFLVKNYGGKAFSVEIAASDERKKRIDVISHLDVVGIGKGWSKPPFGGIIEDNRLYGRGVADMKRAAIIVYYALKIIRDYQFPLKNDLRLVYGTDEETDMCDLEDYVSSVPSPDFALTPDGNFPVNIGEKGALSWEITGKLPEESVIESLSGGEGGNVVPSFAVLVLKSGNEKMVIDYIESKQWAAKVSRKENYLIVELEGVGAHASTPELGVNALCRALQLVSDVFQDDFAMKIDQLFRNMDGSGLGFEIRTAEMGHLTFNLGRCRTNEDGTITFETDIRYPLGRTSQEMLAVLKERLPQFEVKATFDVLPTFQDEKRPAIQTLLTTFHDYFPKHSIKPKVSGGVSYSKRIANCVGFGAQFDWDEEVAHQADEYVDMNGLEELLAMYTEAILSLCQLEEL